MDGVVGRQELHIYIYRLLQVTAIVSNLDQVVHWYIQGGSKAGSSWHLDNQSTFQ
jgi:hypothetical protein